MSHWLYKNQPLLELPEKVMGFVYIITGPDRRKYIGRKYVTRRVKTKVNTKSKTAINKKKTKITLKESDWQTYTGSNKQLTLDIEKFGKDQFKFEILVFGETKGHVNFLEEFFQMRFNVLLDPTFYNDSVGARGFIALKNNQKLFEIVHEIERSL